jgi:hypothetical protein
MANKKLSELAEKANLPNNALIHILDPNDLSQSPQGSDFKFDSTKLLSKSAIVDDLLSTSTTSVLSANQGRELNVIKENISNKKNTLIGNESSNSFYSTIKGIIDYFTSSRLVSILGFTPQNVANKQNSLAVDGTGSKYTTVDAVNAGLNTKISGTGTTNQIAKFTGSGTVGPSSIGDDGVNVSIGASSNFAKLNIVTIDGAVNQKVLNFKNPDFGIYAVANTLPSEGNSIDFIASSFNAGSPIERNSLSLSVNGNVGINQPNPTEKLDVIGNGKFSGTVTASPAELQTELATLGQVNSFRPYKVYTALLSQSGTNAPVATVLENTLGGVPTYQRNTQGAYQLTLSNAFINLKTALFITDSSASQLRIYRSSASVINIEMSTGDNTLLNNTIEIRVYN